MLNFNRIIFSILLLISVSTYSQSKISKNAAQFQLEAAGPGGLFTFNFDSRFAKKEKGIGFRAGLGGTPLGLLGYSCNRGFQLSIPVGINYLIGKTKHLLELGAGLVPSLIGGTKVFCLPEPGTKNDFFSDETSIYWYLLAGYRYQPVRKKGITYRFFISPLLQKDFPVKFWGGGSIGIRL
ncbi:MAG: hypothetical protein SGI96_02205 [Bacteroidota bacterium]|nr:hypothetical protein [Bacteroidota bacterium]